MLKKGPDGAELTSLSATLLATKPAADNKANDKQIDKLLQVPLAIKLLHLFRFSWSWPWWWQSWHPPTTMENPPGASCCSGLLPRPKLLPFGMTIPCSNGGQMVPMGLTKFLAVSTAGSLWRLWGPDTPTSAPVRTHSEAWRSKNRSVMSLARHYCTSAY